MHIIELKSENFKRLKAVTIKPNGKVVEIAGRNDQGKSSVLDSIWAALGGADAMPAEPIREGQDEALITLDLGDLKVLRKMRRHKEGDGFTTSLQIETPDGMRAKSPQTMLNDLVGRFSLDPMEFVRLSPKLQFDALKALVPGLDLDEITAKNAEDYERRTVENRKAKEAKAAAATIISQPILNPQPTDEAPILEDLARAGDHNAGIEERRKRREKAEEDATTLEGRAKGAQDEIDRLTRVIADLKANVETMTDEASTLRAKLAVAPPLPKPLDTAKLAQALSLARQDNEEVRKRAERDALLAQAEKHEAAANALTEAMDAREEHKRQAIAAAKFPVDGLSLGDGEVLIDGFPFPQAATSKKIRTSMALAMAMNPKIRVIRIMDGSLLDHDAMGIVAEMAETSDFQVWVERLDPDGKTAILIEDGHIKEGA